MKSFDVLGWVVLVNVSWLAACGGVSSIGRSGGGGDFGVGGSKASGAAGSGVGPRGGGPGAAGSTGGLGSGATAGAGTGASSGVGCLSNDECPGAGDPCEMCPDGTRACNFGYCDPATGTCKRNGGLCGAKCTTNKDCPELDLACTTCEDGSHACPSSECLMGFCQVSYPGCIGFDPCKGLECGSQCKSCAPDGMCDAPVLSFCNARGKCQPGPPSCGMGQCQTKMECGTAPPICFPCTDGTCASIDCVSNQCALTCPTASLACKYTEECPTLNDGVCTSMCPNGKCAVPACLQNTCQLVCPVN